MKKTKRYFFQAQIWFHYKDWKNLFFCRPGAGMYIFYLQIGMISIGLCEDLMTIEELEEKLKIKN